MREVATGLTIDQKEIQIHLANSDKRTYSWKNKGDNGPSTNEPDQETSQPSENNGTEENDMPEIFDPGGILEESEKKLLVKKEGLKQLSVLRRLDGGFSGAKVILVEYSLEKEQGYPRSYPSKVLKIGDPKVIKQEWENWKTHVEFLPKGCFAQIQAYYKDVAHRCIEYSYTDESTEHISFKEFYKKNLDPSFILEELFSKTLSHLYANLRINRIVPAQKLKKWLDIDNENSSKKLTNISNFLRGNDIDPSYPGLYAIELLRTIPNPLCLLQKPPFSNYTLTISERVVHGDLNAENIRISKQEKCCLIDFYYTGRAEAIMDYAKLESVVKFELLEETGNEQDVKRLLEIEDILVSRLNPSAEDIATSGDIAASANTQRAMKVVVSLREQLQTFINSSQGADEKIYWLCLFSYALTTASYDTLSCLQRLYAFISAALIAEKHLFPSKDTDRIAQEKQDVGVYNIWMSSKNNKIYKRSQIFKALKGLFRRGHKDELHTRELASKVKNELVAIVEIVEKSKNGEQIITERQKERLSDYSNILQQNLKERENTKQEEKKLLDELMKNRLKEIERAIARISPYEKLIETPGRQDL